LKGDVKKRKKRIEAEIDRNGGEREVESLMG
jgi:hypothetical protein